MSEALRPAPIIKRFSSLKLELQHRKKSAGRMGCHPYDPLTTTNSVQESEMADANSKSRPKKRKPRKPNTILAMMLRNSPDRPKRGWPYLPWMHVVDMHFKLFGFEPGDRVFLDINHVTRKITITPDYSELNQREQPYHQHPEAEQPA